MQQHRQPSMRWIAGLAALCLALLAWIYVGFIEPFRAAAGGRDVLAFRLDGYGADDVVAMVDFLRSHPDAALIQHGFHAGPALLLPFAPAALIILLLKRTKPGGAFFGRTIPGAVISVIFFLPVLYALADFSETMLGLLILPPATPSQQVLATAAHVLPIIGRLKFVALAISVILLIRFAVLGSRITTD